MTSEDLYICIGFGVLTAVVKRSSVFWDKRRVDVSKGNTASISMVEE
jgi:hypothetical protein